MSTRVEQRSDLLAQARTIVTFAKDADRDLTADEARRVDTLLAKADDLAADIAKADLSAATFARLARITHPEHDPNGVGTVYLASRSAMAADIASAMTRQAGVGPTFGSKSLITAGDVYTDVPLLVADPFEQPRPPTSIIDALPVVTVNSPTFSYLRQETRTNRAAPVAVGGTKPTSVYGLTQYDGKLHVIAHVSEPFDEYWVADAAGLSRFLEAEMTYGLRAALEAQVLTGDGTGANLTGLAHTSGIQTQAFTTSMFVTTRKAVTAVDTLGYVPRMFVLSPVDWETFETTALASGNYVLNAEGQGNLPVDAAARRLWGVPVVLSTAQAAGNGWLISAGSVEVVTDGQIKVQTSNAVGTDFTTNSLRMRVETRADLAVTSPAGIVTIDLAA